MVFYTAALDEPVIQVLSITSHEAQFSCITNSSSVIWVINNNFERPQPCVSSTVTVIEDKTRIGIRVTE